ncbi:prenyltransferase/squalene oxidase repeat-containing protein, partial [Streptomyces sp. NPDC127110]|uniref:prenyltransferase/squalene oxidase repeat-containing protein n=1 Tax=Streptomyces sp. NPDC127110 TaxID=3345362 RepID=UPI003642E711
RARSLRVRLRGGRISTRVYRAVAAAVAGQGDDGAWAQSAQPRILETALCCIALAQTGQAGGAVDRACRWLSGPAQDVRQGHEAFVAAADRWLRALALAPVDPQTIPALPPGGAAHHGRRVLLLHTVAVACGAPGIDAADLLARCRAALGAGRGRGLKGWQRCVYLSGELIATGALGGVAPDTAVAELEAEQSEDGAFHAMPAITAICLLALHRVGPERASTRRCLQSVLAGQRPDGTWRFTAFDVWDTGLMVRCLRGLPDFDRTALTPALEFLARHQSSDGGWPSAQGIASDNDTTGNTLLALRGTAHGDALWPAAARYVRTRRRADGLWTTWQSDDDEPAEDVVAHMVAGVRAHDVDRTIDTDPAVRWLGARHRAHGRFKAHWYAFPGYPVSEIAPVVGWHSREVAADVADLAAAQRPDGGWPRLPDDPHSSAAATALAVTALTRSPGGHHRAVERAARFLIDRQRGDGTWEEPGPFMYGPRPFLAQIGPQAHAFTCRGLADLLQARQPGPVSDDPSPCPPAATGSIPTPATATTTPLRPTRGLHP